MNQTKATADRPKTFKEAINDGHFLTPEEEARLEGRKAEAAARGVGSVEELDELERREEEEAAKAPDPLSVAAMNPEAAALLKEEWVSKAIPEGLKIPRGRQVQFCKFRAEWTVKPELGDRVCVLWINSIGDEKLARKRARGDSLAVYEELAKQTVRVIDGMPANWTGKRGPGSGSVEDFWEQIGPSCRQMIVNLYHKTHSLTAEQQADFLVNCYDVRTVDS